VARVLADAEAEAVDDGRGCALCVADGVGGRSLGDGLGDAFVSLDPEQAVSATAPAQSQPTSALIRQVCRA
jgi:hypothetical protein